MSPADRRRRADDLVQERLGGGVALQRRVFAALLVVQDEAQRETCAVRPLWIGRMLAVADEISVSAQR
jgi:hypothetical protein